MIKKTLPAMIEIQRKESLAYIGEGEFELLQIDFRTALPSTEIDDFEKNTGCIIPNDYKDFLLFTNGMQFYRAGDFELFDIATISKVREIMDYMKGVYAIGNFLEDYIVINSNDISTGSYLYYGPGLSSRDFRPFGHNFEVFLDRLLMSQIQKYWDWFPQKQMIFDFSR